MFIERMTANLAINAYLLFSNAFIRDTCFTCFVGAAFALAVLLWDFFVYCSCWCELGLG